MNRARPPVAAALLLAGLLPACVTPRPLPPDHLDRARPEGAFRVFRGAVAQEDVAAEWLCLSDGFRRRFGVSSRAEYRDARQVALKQDSLAIRGILRAEVDRAERRPDGRVLLHLDLPLWFRGRVWMKKQDVLRIEFEDESEAPVYFFLRRRRLVWDNDVAGIGASEIMIPGEGPITREELELLAEDLAGVGGFRRFFAGTWWFIDDFAFGNDDREDGTRS